MAARARARETCFRQIRTASMRPETLYLSTLIPNTLAMAVTVAFASQTGTAREFAERFAREATWRGYATTLLPFEAVPLSPPAVTTTAAAVTAATATRHVVFFVSTTGDGDFPDHAVPAWRALLSRGLPHDALSALRFSVFGLGDSSYAKFNAAARKLCTRLLQLGGELFAERGLGDEGSPFGLAGDYDAWEKGAWPALAAAFPSAAPPPGAEEARAHHHIPRCRFTVKCVGGRSARSPQQHPFAWPLPCGLPAGLYPPLGGLSACTPSENPSPFLARVVENRRLTAPGWTQDVRHIELDITGYFDGVEGGATTCFTGSGGGDDGYLPGDVAVVYPSNEAGNGGVDVAALAARLGVDLEDVIEIDRVDEGSSDSTTTTIGLPACSCAHCIDVTASFTAEAVGVDSVDGACPYTIPPHVASFATLSPLAPPTRFPLRTPITVRHLLSHCLDIRGTPRRSFFGALVPFVASGDAEASGKLAELSSPEGADLFASYCVRERRSYIEVLADFPSVRLPLPFLLEMLPPLQPRHFSIASSYAARPGRLALCVAVVDYKTPWGRQRRGTASAWLAARVPALASHPVDGEGGEGVMHNGGAGYSALTAASFVPLFVRRGVFKLPPRQLISGQGGGVLGSRPPLLLIGPGTGIAPMRAIVQELAVERQRLPQAAAASSSETAAAEEREGGGNGSSDGGGGAEGGGVHLYFGCRHAASDWLYGEEFQAALTATATTTAAAAPVTITSTAMVPAGITGTRDSNTSWPVVTGGGILADYQTAFSRDSLPKVVYVQGLLLRRAGDVFRLLTQEGAYVFISGSAKRMPADVVGVLGDILVQQGGASEAEAAAFIAGMERAGRLVIEAWS